jgi:hypothetical protein
MRSGRLNQLRLSTNNIRNLAVTKLVSVMPRVTRDADLLPGQAAKFGLVWGSSSTPNPPFKDAPPPAWRGPG